MSTVRDHDSYARLRQYCLPLYVPEELGNTEGSVDFEGTASILEVGEDVFLITATHVLDTADHTHLLYPIGSEGLAELQGIRLRYEPDQDEYDIGVVRMKGPPPIASVLRLRLDDIYLGDTPPQRMTVGCGYPETKNRVRRGSKHVKTRCYSVEWPTKPHDVYTSVGLNPHHHIILDYDMRTRPNKLKLPKLVGMSGGPIWVRSDGRDKVIGVIQYHDPGSKSVYGTKITLALGGIARVFPHLAPYIPVAPMPEHLIKSDL